MAQVITSSASLHNLALAGRSRLPPPRTAGYGAPRRARTDREVGPCHDVKSGRIPPPMRSMRMPRRPKSSWQRRTPGNR